MPNRSRARSYLLASLTLGALVSCGAETTVSLTIDGAFPEARELYVRVIGATGPLGTPYRFPEENRTLKLPGTVVLFPGPHERLGFVVWAQSGAGAIIAMARSATCVPVSTGGESRYRLRLAAPAAGWTPAAAERCYCNPMRPMDDMCPPTGIPDDVRPGGRNGSGAAGGFGGAGGTGGGLGGTGGGGQGGAGGGLGGTGGGGQGGAGGGLGGTGGGGQGGTGGGLGGTGGGGQGGAGGGLGGTGGGGQSGAGGTSSAGLFSFDHAGDWTSAETTVTLDSMLRSQGAASITFVPAAVGATYIRSRPFATRETPGATGKLALDVRLAQAQTPQANLQMWFECRAAAVYNAYVEYRSLAQVPPMVWTTITFNLPQPVVAALSGDHSGCLLWVDHQAAGLAHYDNLRFVP